MSYSIVPTQQFAKELKRLAKKFPSLKNEFAKLIIDITTNPEMVVLLSVRIATKFVWPLIVKERAKVVEQGLSRICTLKLK